MVPRAGHVGSPDLGRRLVSIDVLRAVALLGILLVNVEYFSAPVETNGYGIRLGLDGGDYAVAWLEYVFLRGNVWTLFALLFGMGFAVMFDRAGCAVRNFAALYLRRIGMLFVFGVAHMVFVWAGDILHLYAFSACILLMMLYGRPLWILVPVPIFLAMWIAVGDREYLAGVVAFSLFSAFGGWIRHGGADRLWRSGIALYASVSLVVLAVTVPGLWSSSELAPYQRELVAERIAEWNERIVNAAAVNANGGYAENLVLRMNHLVDALPGEIYALVYAVGMFLIGVWCVRSGTMHAIDRYPGKCIPWLRRAAWTGIATGIGLTIASIAISTAYDPYHPESFTVAAHIKQLASMPLSLGYAAAAVSFVYGGKNGVRLRWLAPAGRMTLTNYLAQSLLGTLVFYGYGLGMWGRIGHAGQLILVSIIFVAQVAFSRWWLTRFSVGPVEWLWRAMTYRRWPEFVRERRARIESGMYSAATGSGCDSAQGRSPHESPPLSKIPIQ